MRKKNNRRRKRGSRRGRLWKVIPPAALLLSLIWVWKADMVKEYYSQMKNLEEQKKVLQRENARLSGQLSELKSLTRVDRIVTERYGLTQDVAGRMTIEDPIRRRTAKEKFLLVDTEEITDWLERAVFQSNSVSAREQESATKGEN
jgi:hypothetical protein